MWVNTMSNKLKLHKRAVYINSVTNINASLVSMTSWALLDWLRPVVHLKWCFYLYKPFIISEHNTLWSFRWLLWLLFQENWLSEFEEYENTKNFKWYVETFYSCQNGDLMIVFVFVFVLVTRTVYKHFFNRPIYS